MPTNPNTPEPIKPRGRWFQFRLRTLLIGVALLAVPCGYVAHEASIVRARKAWLATHDASEFEEGEMFRNTPIAYHSSKPEYAPSALRRWLGDVEYALIATSSGKDTEEAERLFPEAFIDFSPAFDQPSDATDTRTTQSEGLSLYRFGPAGRATNDSSLEQRNQVGPSFSFHTGLADATATVDAMWRSV